MSKASYETTRYRHGLLTYSLLRAIKGGLRLREDKFLDIASLFFYAQDTVPTLANDVGRTQRPLVITPLPTIAFNEHGSFDIGMFTAAEQSLITLESPRAWVLRPVLINLAESFDNLNLTPLLREALRSASDIAFVDTDEMGGAIKPSGSYRVDGQSIIVSLRLIRDGVPVGTSFSVRGSNGKEQLIKELATVIQKSISEVEP